MTGMSDWQVVHLLMMVILCYEYCLIIPVSSINKIPVFMQFAAFKCHMDATVASPTLCATVSQ